MSRLHLVDPATASPEQRAALQSVQERLGAVPPPVRAMANAPVAVKAFFGLHGALEGGQLPRRLREQLALAVSKAQDCGYCVAHHHQLGRAAGLSAQELELALAARAPDARTEALLQFAVQLAARRGAVTDEELAAVRAAGWGDGELVEVLAAVVATTFGNYLNRLAQAGH